MSRILVAYASKHGATAEIAEAVAAELQQAGHEVDCLSAEQVHGLDVYDAAIIGSAVYMKRWRPEARRLLKRYLLRELPHRTRIGLEALANREPPALDLDVCPDAADLQHRRAFGSRCSYVGFCLVDPPELEIRQGPVRLKNGLMVRALERQIAKRC